jgi:hypothetical protein
MKAYEADSRCLSGAPVAIALHQLVTVHWMLDKVMQHERGRVVGLADSAPEVGPGWWYLVEILEGIEPGTRDWFTAEQMTIHGR